MFLNEVINSIKISENKSIPFDYIETKFDVSEKLEEEMLRHFPKKFSNRSQIEKQAFTVELKDDEFSENIEEVKTYWNYQLNDEITNKLIRVLFKKLKVPSSFSINKFNRTMFLICRKLETKFKIRILSNMIKKLDYYYDDGYRPVYNKFDSIDYKYKWNFVERRGDDKFDCHTDSTTKIFSLLLPLTPKKYDGKLNGTTIFVPKKKINSYESARYDSELFSRFHQTKHLIGEIFAFAKTTDSWHGIDKKKNDTSLYRRTLMLNVYHK